MTFNHFLYRFCIKKSKKLENGKKSEKKRQKKGKKSENRKKKGKKSENRKKKGKKSEKKRQKKGKTSEKNQKFQFFANFNLSFVMCITVLQHKKKIFCLKHWYDFFKFLTTVENNDE